MPIAVTQDLITAVTTKDKALSDGRTLARKGSLQGLHASADGGLLWGECQGSGAKPYVMSIDLAGDHPTIRCTCPVKPPPCKHTLAMLVHFLEQPAAFPVTEPPAELIEKRLKNLERAEKKAEAATKPKTVNLEALAKKTRVQRDALDLLEKLVSDLAAAGLGALDGPKAAALVDQARQLTDAYLPGAAEGLRRLAGLAVVPESSDEERFYQDQEPGQDLPDDLRRRLMVRHLTRLWAMVRKGQKALDEKRDEGSDGETDAVVEDLLGRVWELAALTAKGYVAREVRLLELADERYTDAVRGERIEQGWLLDLASGAIQVERKFRPIAALDKVKEKDSHERPLTITEAGLYPGFINRRIRWELSALTSRPLSSDDFTAVHAHALASIDAALIRYKEQIRNPLAPDEAVVLIRAADVRQAGPDLALVDANGAMLLLRDSRLARCRTTNTLAMAAGARLVDDVATSVASTASSTSNTLRQPAALLVRLYRDLADDAILGQPLALVVGTDHIRLGT